MNAVIMCGGSGTRLWPMSRKRSPKQFIKFFNDKSLFELTLERNKDLVDQFFVVVNTDQLEVCQSQISKELSDRVKILVEPIGRNTAPAIAIAALSQKQNTPLLILASDHLINDLKEYETCVLKAKEFAEDDKMVTFGIKPTYPETGYGYIEANENEVISFKEKPPIELAKEYLDAGNFLWNSGMFCFKPNVYLSELEKYAPEILSQSKKALENSTQRQNATQIDLNDMKSIPANSIDYSVMEKSDLIKVVPSSFSWSDMGSFDSLYDVLGHDQSGNTNNSEASVHINSENNLFLTDKKMICTFDVKDLIVVESKETLLIGKRGKAQKVKEILSKVKELYPNLNLD